MGSRNAKISKVNNEMMASLKSTFVFVGFPDTAMTHTSNG